MEDLNRMNAEDFKQSLKYPVVVVLDNVRSMNNVGSVFRSCDAFRINEIYLCGITAQPPHKDIEKTALGATQSVKWTYFNATVDAVTDLIDDNYAVFAVEQVEQSIMLDEFDINKYEKIALIFGNEVLGVEQDVINLCHGCIEIPQFGTKHSLNISVSVGIILWHAIYLYNRKQ
ncbi:MAG: RNA methyltransferase [Bacteroidales bacterium]|nr:RNA methyltransferase [Bacteroidales bacterium]